jgi:hypothetical protein
MGKLQDSLEAVLRVAGDVTKGALPPVRSVGFSQAKVWPEILGTYLALGGVAPTPPTNAGSWDLEFDGIAVELDEDQHFNRYRAITLRSALYDRIRGHDWRVYAKRCDELEAACLKKGGCREGYWTSESCERAFGKAAKVREFAGNGSPRWKQRAFYDFLRDVSTLVLSIRLARLTPDDTIIDDGGARPLSNAVIQPARDTGDKIAKLIRIRTEQGGTTV